MLLVILRKHYTSTEGIIRKRIPYFCIFGLSIDRIDVNGPETETGALLSKHPNVKGSTQNNAVVVTLQGLTRKSVC